MKNIRLAILLCFEVTAVSFAADFTRLYAFTGGADGRRPVGRLLLDAQGNIYGVTKRGGIGFGTVYRLSPPQTPGSPWTQTVLHTFTGGSFDGAWPKGGLISDGQGNLYGTAGFGALTTCGLPDGCGIVFRIAPGSQYTILYKFGTVPADGRYPIGNLAMDASGALYGGTLGGGARGSGTVFQLAPPDTTTGPWTESILHSFSAYTADGGEPLSGVTMSANGSLFGTTEGGGNSGGSIYQVSPPADPGGNWTESVIYKFTPRNGPWSPIGGVTFDPSGTLYTTTSEASIGGSTVFELIPPAQSGLPWTGRIVCWLDGHNGDYPYATPEFDHAGNLWVATESGGQAGAGVLIGVSPPTSTGGSWLKKSQYNFLNSWNGGFPQEGVTVGPADGFLYGATCGGGDSGAGIVYQYKP